MSPLLPTVRACGRAVAAVLLTGALALPTAAWADTASPSPSASPSASGTPSPSASPSGTAGAAQNYSSLSAALIAMYAQQSGQSLSSFLATQGGKIGQTIGDPQLAQLRPASFADLQAQLGSSGLGVGLGSYAALAKTAAALSNRASSPDALVVSAGARFAAALGSLRVPQLAMPQTPGMDTSLAYTMPKQGLQFGLFLDKSLANFVTGYPNLFTQIGKTGLGTPGFAAAWNASMLKAAHQASGSASAGLLDSCQAGLFQVMATNDPSSASKYGSGCGSGCVATGLYLHDMVSKMFDPAGSSTLGSAGKLNLSDLSGLPTFERNALAKANPNLSSQLGTALQAPDAGACSVGDTAAGNTMGLVMPSIVGNLAP